MVGRVQWEGIQDTGCLVAITLTKSDIDNGAIRHETKRLDFFGRHAVPLNVSIMADGQSFDRAYKKYFMPGRYINNHAFQKSAVPILEFQLCSSHSLILFKPIPACRYRLGGLYKVGAHFPLLMEPARHV